MLKNRRNVLILISLVCVILVATLVVWYAYAPWRNSANTSTAIKIPVLYPTSQGLYESCPPSKGDACLTRLGVMARSGFTLVVNYNQFYGTADQELAYAKKAQSLGLKIIWGISSPIFWNGKDLRTEYKDLAATCNCYDNAGFIKYVVGLVKSLPATWGYYIGDEVSSDNHATFKVFADLVKTLDPAHPRLFIAGENTSSMGANVKSYIDTAEVVGADVYPVSTADPISSVGDIARSVQATTDQNGKQSAMVLQSFNWSEYPEATWVCPLFPSCTHFPTQAEMKQMRDLVVKNAHPQFILWYSFFDIYRSGDPASHLKDLVNAASTPTSSKSR